MKGKSLLKTAVEVKVLIYSSHVLWNCKFIGDAVRIWTWPLNNQFWVDSTPQWGRVTCQDHCQWGLFFGSFSLHWATQNGFHVNSLLHDTDGRPCHYCAATFVGCVYTVKDVCWIPTKCICQAIYMYTLLCYIRLSLTCFSSNWVIWCTEYYTKLLAAFWIQIVENDCNCKDKHRHFHKE